jgi:hypothetical protein
MVDPGTGAGRGDAARAALLAALHVGAGVVLAVLDGFLP